MIYRQVGAKLGANALGAIYIFLFSYIFRILLKQKSIMPHLFLRRKKYYMMLFYSNSIYIDIINTFYLSLLGFIAGNKMTSRIVS